MHTRGNSISVTWGNLLIWGLIVLSGSTARGDDPETVASLKQRNLRQEAALKAANAEIEQLTNEVNRLKRKLEAIRRELDKEGTS